MKNNLEQTQSLLYLGYVLLVVLGIIHETLFYSQFGINILECSDILDVLLSPISRLTSNKMLLVLSFVVTLPVLWLPKRTSRLKHRKWFANFFKLTAESVDAEKRVLNVLTFFAVIFFVGIFVGSGIGRGTRLQNKIASGAIEYNDTIHFIDDDAINVAIIGKNSSYVFYIKEGNTHIEISPISGAVKSLRIVE